MRRTMIALMSAGLVACGGGSSEGEPGGSPPSEAAAGGEAVGGEAAGGEAAGGEASSGAEPTEGVAGGSRSPHDTCVATMERERECSEQLLPALVALRVRLDQPAGTAARDASEGREVLVAEAQREYARDATDQNIEANCSQMEQIPAEQAQRWTEMMHQCLAAAGCEAFVECDMRFTEARFTGG